MGGNFDLSVGCVDISGNKWEMGEDVNFESKLFNLFTESPESDGIIFSKRMQIVRAMIRAMEYEKSSVGNGEILDHKLTLGFNDFMEK